MVVTEKEGLHQGQIIWGPSKERIKSSNMFDFLQKMSTLYDFEKNWDSLYSWSIEEPAEFWRELAVYTKVKWSSPRGDQSIGALGSKIELNGRVLESKGMLQTTWFQDRTLNFAENLLNKDKSGNAIVSYLEGCERQAWSWRALYDQVEKLASALRSIGVGKGDRVCGVMVNGPHAIASMLATSSIGAIWASSSPDFGLQGILDRFTQIEPKVIFYSKSYMHGGKTYECAETAQNIKKAISSITAMVIVDHLTPTQDSDVIYEEGLICYESFVSPSFVGGKHLQLDFEACRFSDPLYILFSSGTTGVPKCIVHSVGGTLLQHKKELMLHTDLSENDILFYFTTCGWMMWNWMVSSLSVGATVVTFDGSVSSPDLGVLWDIVDKEKVKIFGTSPKFLSACMKQEISPCEIMKGHKLKTILSTGAPLLEEHFKWIYSNFPDDLQLSSISGGTDIISCFMLGNPLLPVIIGEIQSRGLGMAVEAWTEGGNAVVGEKAELVCTKPFVSMPVCFWNDKDKSMYKSAYFDFYDSTSKPGQEFTSEVWRHGDFIELTPGGGVVVYGRSDATLNPGGVRIGTAEIYRVVESDPNIEDSIVVGFPRNGDVEIYLFLKLTKGRDFSSFDEFSRGVIANIKRQLTPRHAPKKVFEVTDIPYTKSGKKVEIATLKALQGEEITNESALVNPTCLREYERLGKSLG